MKKRIWKRAAAFGLSAALALTLAACGPKEEAEATPTPGQETSAGAYTPGSYTATAAGRNGDVTLTVTFSADRIEEIVHESQETETIGVTAMDDLTRLVLENQALGVDMVAGATLTCEAYLAALSDCVEQAGGDVSALKAKTVAGGEQEGSYVTTADVVIVGAGGAGLTAALTAAQSGAKVILLEKSGMVGGNTLCATMGINAAGSQVQKDAGNTATVEDFVAGQLNNEDARENLVRALCERSGETIDWFTGLGVAFEPGRGDFMLMATADGVTSVTMVNALNRALEDTDVELYLNMEVTDLVMEGGKVAGCVATDAKGEQLTFSGKSVILCTGGFGQNRELMAQYRPDLATAITDEIAPTTGQGLVMAQKVGAQAVNLDSIQLFPHVIVGYGLLTPNNLPGGFGVKGIYVNQAAQRFVAEGFEVSDAILAQPDGMAYCIFNEADLSDGLSKLVANGFVVSGDTPAELAAKLGLDGDALTATIEKWNADCAAGTDSLFGKEGPAALEGKLYGYNFGVGAHYFMGGILIDENTRVLNAEGQPIDGLYAAGEVTGGFHGTYRVDGCGTADAFVFGRIAGETAANAAR